MIKKGRMRTGFIRPFYIYVMQLPIKVIARAKKNFLKQEPDRWKVYVTAPATQDRANEAVIGFLSEHFGVKKSAISIVKGLKSHYKIVNIFGIH